MDPVFKLSHKCIQFKNSGGDAPGLWCKQVVYSVKTPVGRDITPDNTVLSRAISTSAAGAMGRGPPKNAHSRERSKTVYKGVNN
jgi:hypothetical protein